MSRRPRFERIDPVDLASIAPHGIARVGSDRGGSEQLLHAALLYGGAGAVITGVHALRRHDLTRRPGGGPVRVLVPAARRRRSTERFLVERTERLPDGVVRGGVRVAPVERAVLDTARTLTVRDEVREVIAESVQRGRTTAARLADELRQGSQRGAALPRRVLRDVEIGIRSVSEGWGLDLHRRSDLPPMTWNPRLFLPDGRFLASPDAYLEDVAMAWEVDSREFHLSPEEWEATLRRRSDMINAQVVVAHHTPRFILDQPEQVIADLWGAYRLAASRPRPMLIVRSSATAA